jgi:5-methylcytosine-specific restriction endonuclease McrA
MPITVQCKLCGGGFSVKPSHVGKRVYCSHECMTRAYTKPRRKLICVSCGKEFMVPDRESRKNAQFCSKKCMGIGQTGENHWNYQHGQKWDPEREKEYRRTYYEQNKEMLNQKAFLHKAKSRTGLKVKGSHTFEEWQTLVERNEHKCFYCGVVTTSEEGKRKLTRDHLIPLSKGGTDDISNVVPSCKSCNGSKGDKTLEEWKRVTVIETASTDVKGVE